jgi:CubicO group peptidase (beta-lactamase class C family)
MTMSCADHCQSHAVLQVGHVLRMESGVADFDVPDFDEKMLTTGGQGKHSPLEFVEYAATQVPKLQFEPGTQVIDLTSKFVFARARVCVCVCV